MVQALAEYAAVAAGCTLAEIVSGRARKPTRARHAAWLTILKDTGCSVSGLSDVWGCHRGAILRVMRAAA